MVSNPDQFAIPGGGLESEAAGKLSGGLPGGGLDSDKVYSWDGFGFYQVQHDLAAMVAMVALPHAPLTIGLLEPSWPVPNAMA